MKLFIRVAAAVVAVACLALPALGSSEYRLQSRTFDALRAPSTGKALRLEGLPLGTQGSRIDLEEFHVWTADGAVSIHGEEGVRRVPPPARRFFRGTVDGDSQSFAFVAVDDTTKAITGLIATTTGRFAIRSERPRRDRPSRATTEESQPFDFYLAEADEQDLMPGTEEAWSCLVDRRMVDVPVEPTAKVAELSAAGSVTSQALSGSQAYAITLEIETDYELYQNAGSNATTLTNYVTDLVGAMATIYARDLSTQVRLKDVHVYPSASDPWTQTGGAGLDEVAAYYNSVSRPAGRTTTAVAMLSGKDFGGGIAYEGVVGAADWGSGSNWGGTYSWNGGIGRLFGDTGLGSIPDPDATTGGVPYGMPFGLQNYWPLAELSHELGHNLAGHHTHCIGVTDAERIASGFTDGSPATAASNQVDHCYGSEGETSCYAGTDYQLGAETTFKGTIMSYCHNVWASGVPQSRFVFGPVGEPSNRQLTDYMLRSGGPVQQPGDGRDGGTYNLVNALSTFALTSMTVPASVPASSTGNAASMVASTASGTTYQWEIVNGTITSGQGTASITFTAGASGNVTLRAIAYRPNRVGVAETKTVTIQSESIAPPTNVIATGISSTSVHVTWTASVGATSYSVWRTQGGGYTNVSFGMDPTGTSFIDMSADPNTAYIYQVEAHGASSSSTLSIGDFATTVIFTDSTLSVGTPVKAVHLTQLRTAANMIRALIGAPAPTYTDPTITPGLTVVHAEHFVEVETALLNARASQGMSVPELIGFADGGPMVANDIKKLRSLAK